MPPYRTQSPDITRSAERFMIEAWRKATPAEKIHQASELWRAGRELSLVGLRQRHPEAGEHELQMRLGVLWYGAEPMRRFHDWVNPEDREPV